MAKESQYMLIAKINGYCSKTFLFQLKYILQAESSPPILLKNSGIKQMTSQTVGSQCNISTINL